MKWILKNGSSLFEVSSKHSYINYRVNLVTAKNYDGGN